MANKATLYLNIIFSVGVASRREGIAPFYPISPNRVAPALI